MAPPVWALSVDLQTKTATFQSGLADAARAARGAFTDIKSGSREMAGAVGGSMTEARHGVMLLGEEFGVHLPRGLTTFIASIGPIGAAMEAAFPFLAIAVGATLLLEHLASLHAAGGKLTEDQVHFGIAVQNAFNQLDEKLDRAKIKSDELRGDHLGALSLQLDLINRQSMDQLIQSFSEIAKASDVVFADLKTHFWNFDKGSEGAKHALDDFQAHYELLLKQGKDKEASDLLAGTLDSAKKILTLQEAANATIKPGADKGGDGFDTLAAKQQALVELRRMNKDYGDKEVAAQQQLVGVLSAQVEVESKTAELKKLQAQNTTTETHKTMSGEAERAAKEKQEAEKRAAEEAQRAAEEAYRARSEALAQSEKETIEKTKEGSAARLAAIDTAIKQEQIANMEGTSAYKDLLNQRIELVRQMGEEEDKLRASAAREAADNELKMGELSIAMERQQMETRASMNRISGKQRLDEEIKLANDEFALKQTALNKEIAALVKSDRDYENKVKESQDKIKQLTQQHENEISAIKDKAAKERNAKLLAAERQYIDQISSGLTQSIMGHKSWASMMSSVGNEVVTGLIQNATKSIMAHEMSKMPDAEAAARKAYLAGVSVGGPGAPITGALYAAEAFAKMMAFETGGIVPGVERGDVVPAMLAPGEAVLPRSMSEGLQRAANSGDMGGGHHYHVHAPVQVHASALDSDGIDKVLDKHSHKIQKHFENTLRKMNH